MPMWDTYIGLILLFVVLQVGYALLVRTFPEVLGGALLKSLDHRNAEKLEKLKGELSLNSAKELDNLRTDYQTLRDSTVYLAANQAELRSKMIASAELLWNDMLALRDTFGSLITFETIFLPKELAEAFEHGSHSKIMHFVNDLRDETSANNKLMRSVKQDAEKARLFVGDKLWLTYYVFRGIICRVAYMTSLSFLPMT